MTEAFPTIIPAAKANIIIDASQFDMFELCPQRFNYRYNLHKTLPSIQKNRALDVGSLCHEGLEAYYTGLASGHHFHDNLKDLALKIRVKSSDATESNIDVEEAEGLIRILEQNLEYWRHEDEMLEILAVEQSFAYPLFEDDYVRIIMSGKIDLLFNKPSLGGASGYKNCPLDHKTFSRDAPVQELSNQFQNYCKATESNYLIVNRIGMQKTVKGEEKFKRVPLSYDSDMLDQWKDNVVYVILHEYAQCVAEQHWPMNYTSCLKFNRMCEYYEVCKSSGKEAKAFKLANNYIEVDPWDVTKKLQED